MRPNGRRAWRAAAKKLRRKMGRRWRSPDAKWSDKRWSELVPNLEAHRGHITGAWFERHGITEQGLQTLDASHLVRVYVGLWGTVDGDYVTYDASPRPLTARSLVGMTMGARKRAHRAAMVGLDYEDGVRFTLTTSTKYRIGERLRPCPGCPKCGVLRFERIGGFGDNTACVEHRVSTGTSRLIRSLGIPWRYSRDRRRSKSAPFHPLNRCMELVDAGQWTLGPELCDGSGVLPARRSK